MNQATAPAAPAQATLEGLKQHGNALALQSADQALDMFTERGFALANRVARAYSTSTAVPAQFRAQIEKKVGREVHLVDNPAALGNCLVAIEVANTVGMSISAVMQNADIIENKLRWSGKFVIAAINVSGRFTPLRFQMLNRGPIKATFKEKTGWDEQARRVIFTDRVVDVDDIECIAWALPKGYPEPKVSPQQMQQFPGRMLDLYKALGLPVIESAPVSMRMVVEEGWYGKSGSKWQTELRTLMFMYRAGSFFGNIHAPDIVMGMGRTSEEERDIAPAQFDLEADGTLTPTPVSELRPAQRNTAPIVERVDEATGEISGGEPPAATPAAAPAATPAPPAAAANKPASEWEPTEEEKAEIKRRELAEAAGKEPPRGNEPPPEGTTTKPPAARRRTTPPASME